MEEHVRAPVPVVEPSPDRSARAIRRTERRPPGVRAADAAPPVQFTAGWQPAGLLRSLSTDLTSTRIRPSSAPSNADERKPSTWSRVQRTTAPKPERAAGDNRTGMPDRLKSGVEGLSGIDLSAVRVRYNSPKPAQLGALAYARGSDIEIGPGQERHLPHEAWHVVQQLQGRVRRTIQAKGITLNDDVALEREADEMGARALGQPEVADGELEAPRRAADGPVQRKVGFEFEVGRISTTKQTTFGGRTKLKKQDRLVTGAHYTVEADEETAADPLYPHPSYSGYADLEFVTSAFPVTVAGFGQLTAALTEISAIVTYISAHPDTNIPANNFPHGAPTANRYARFNGLGGVMSGKPQATIGLSLRALDQLFHDISTNAAGGAGPATSAQELFGGGLNAWGGTDPAASAATTGLASVTAARAAADAEMVATLPPAQHTPELVALMTELILYLDAGRAGVPGYGKTIAGSFMMRTAFDRVYREIPPAGRVLTDAHPDLFALMVCRAARLVNANITDAGDVFSGGIYNDPGKYGPGSAEPKTANQRAHMGGRLTRRAWLQGIAGGVDRLTQAHFPSNKASRLNEIESLGRYGVNTDPMGAQHLPVLELRGLPAIPAGLFPVMAMDIFRYVYAMNTAAAGGNPGQLQALGLNQRIALADPTDVNHAAEMTNAVNAAAAAVAAWGAGTGGD